MKNTINKCLIMIAICTVGIATMAQAQTYNIGNAKANAMKLSGTSTLHKWDMNAQAFIGQAQFSFKPGSNQLAGVTALNFILAVLNLKSDSKMMDENAYKALRTDQNKNITYRLTSATVTPQSGATSMVHTKGNLTIAGVTKQIAMDVACTVNADATITCKGEDKLNMTDYQVKPPTFMAGAMKTGDALTLDFTLVYNK